MKKLIYLIPYIGFKSYVKNLPSVLEDKDKLYYDIITIYHGACFGFLVGFPVMKLVDIALS
jgi:hypothetical protein